MGANTRNQLWKWATAIQTVQVHAYLRIATVAFNITRPQENNFESKQPQYREFKYMHILGQQPLSSMLQDLSRKSHTLQDMHNVKLYSQNTIMHYKSVDSAILSGVCPGTPLSSGEPVGLRSVRPLSTVSVGEVTGQGAVADKDRWLVSCNLEEW